MNKASIVAIFKNLKKKLLLLVLFASETKPPVLTLPLLRRTADDAAAAAASADVAAPFSVSRTNGQFERCAAAPNGSSRLRKRVTVDLQAEYFTTAAVQQEQQQYDKTLRAVT